MGVFNMNKKITALVIVLIFSLCCAGIAFAENESADSLKTADDGEGIEVEESSGSITITGISNGKISFSDGFAGYAIDSSKDKITGDDTFDYGEFKNSQMENYIKLAIIEAYKQGKENQLGEIISKIADNNLDKSDSVISEVLKSGDTVKSKEVVSINDNTEGTFTFELLKSANGEKSDCIAYTVSLKSVENDKLAMSDDTGNVVADDNGTSGDDNTNDTNNDKTSQDNNTNTDNDNAKKEDDKTSNDVKKKSDKNDDVKENPENNTTIVKTTTTVIENNTTITHNNVKEVNNTTEPKNDTVSDLLKAGNPILILVIVVVVAVIAAVIMKRKD